MNTQSDITQTLVQHLVTLLRTDSTINSMVSGVYEHVPQGTALPYVHVSVAEAQSEQAGALYISRLELQCDVWSEYRGSKQSLAIADVVEQRLTKQQVGTEDSWHLISWRLEQSEQDVMNDQITRRHRLQFMALIQHDPTM